MTAVPNPVVIGDCTLYQGDCLEILPTLGKVDAVVTDPPYGVKVNTDNSRFSGGSFESVRRRPKKPISRKKLINDEKPINITPILLGSRQIIWGWNNYADQLPKGACLVWIKRNDDAFGTFLGDAEVAWLSAGHGVFCFRDLSNYQNATTRQHPTEKPVSLMEWCIKKTTGTIFDPFMGSGTTGVACVKLGRKFIGIELEERYFKIACDRIKRAYDEPRLPLAEPKPKQEKMEL